MVLEYSNLFFSFLFAVEMLLKIVSDGPFGYIRDGFNVFDGFIVVLRSLCLSVSLSLCLSVCLSVAHTQSLLLPPPKKEVIFLVRSVCLSVRRITRKLVNGF